MLFKQTSSIELRIFLIVFFYRLLVELLSERDRRKQLREALERQIEQEKENLRNEQQRKLYEEQVILV